MARERTQKKISTRIDRTYFKKSHPWRRMRLTLVFLASAAAVLFVALAGASGRGDLIHNPGHLTAAHASFENNCAACHDGVDAQGKKTGQFSKAVSDAACLKCHDGSIHHENQATLVMDDKSHPGGRSSADCASCHTEHRGHEALLTTNDLQCTSCHADLSGKTKKPPAPGVPTHVTAFTLNDHPHFGRSLRQGDKKEGEKLVDPTVLRFNHKKHYGPKTLQGDQRQCTWCHNPDPGAAAALTWESGKTAYALPGGASPVAPVALSDGSARRRSLTQVNYAKNCEGCHALGTLPNSDLAIPHAEMADVRKVILAYVADRSAPWQKFAPDKTGPKEKPVNDRIAAKLNPPPELADTVSDVTSAVKKSPLSVTAGAGVDDAKLPPELLAELLAAAKKLPVSQVPKADQDKLAAALSSTTRPSDHVRPLVLSKLRDEVAKSGGADKEALLAKFDAAVARMADESPDPRLFQAYVAYANDSGASCVKCHDVQGSAAAVPAEWALLRAGKSADAAPSTAPAPDFRTQPTGIPAGPRRWYVNSEFSHDAHRDMNCVECHAAALNSEKTSDVLSPDLQWEGLRFKPGSTTVMESATRSCMECHHEANEHGQGAPANCTECHGFHDRTKERPAEAIPADVLNGVPPGKGEVAAAKP